MPSWQGAGAPGIRRTRRRGRCPRWDEAGRVRRWGRGAVESSHRGAVTLNFKHRLSCPSRPRLLVVIRPVGSSFRCRGVVHCRKRRGGPVAARTRDGSRGLIVTREGDDGWESVPRGYDPRGVRGVRERRPGCDCASRRRRRGHPDAVFRSARGSLPGPGVAPRPGIASGGSMRAACVSRRSARHRGGGRPRRCRWI